MFDKPSETDAETAAPSEELLQVRAKLDEVMRAYSRMQQDKDDFRRRAEREKERVLEAERGKIALLLAETVDQLELSLAAASPESQADGLAAGVRLIRDGLIKQIEQNGLVRMNTENATFDPNQHEAVETIPVANPDLDGKVLGELRTGYLRGDRVLRPARVAVGKHVAGGNN